MTKSEVLELAVNGENSFVEFKRDDGLRPEQLAKEIVAMANLKGGHILLGVDDDGSIAGIQRSDLAKWVIDTVFARYVHPQIVPLYKEVQIDGQKRVAVITVDMGSAKPYVVRHRDREDFYIRSGSTSRLATREQIIRLSSLGGMLYTEQLPVSGSGLENLSMERLSDYLATIMEDQILPASDEEWHMRLCDLGFMVEREIEPPACTIAGLILFGHSPRRYLPQAGIRWIVYEGKSKSYQSPDDRVFDDPMVALWKKNRRGSRELVEDGLIEKLVSAMRPFISEEADSVDESMRRPRRWLYPVEVLREAVINAIAHRDWTRYEEMEISRYADRVEIFSPGSLLNGMTVEKMVAGRRAARNSLIVRVLSEYNYVDAKGMGVRNKIIPLMRDQNGTEPEFVATEDYLQLILRIKPQDDRAASG